MKLVKVQITTRAYHVDLTLPESKVIPYVKRLLATYNQLPWPLRGGFHVIFERIKG